MKQSTINTIRDYFHYFGGAVLSYFVFNGSKIIDAVLWQKALLFSILGGLLCVLVGWGWEWGNEKFLTRPSDITDVFRTAIGGVIGGVLGAFLVDIIHASTYLLVVCGLIVVYDLYKAIKR